MFLYNTLLPGVQPGNITLCNDTYNFKALKGQINKAQPNGLGMRITTINQPFQGFEFYDGVQNIISTISLSSRPFKFCN